VALGRHLALAGGSIGKDGTWSATGYAYFGPAPSLTAYGYCMRV
jgi:hypothetical protein